MGFFRVLNFMSIDEREWFQKESRRKASLLEKNPSHHPSYSKKNSLFGSVYIWVIAAIFIYIFFKIMGY